jgi:hypothetical protein
MGVAPKNTRNEGVSTVSGPDKKWIDTPPLTTGQVTAKFKASLAGWRRHMISNARYYANLRQDVGRSAKPRYLISDFGLISNNGYDRRRFTWTYIPPQAASVTIWPAGKIRPWSFIVVHSMGGTFEAARMWPKKGGSGARLYVSSDKYGHDNRRWMAGLRELTKSRGLSPGARPVSIHFCVSRRGDVVVSADLNDLAWHAGGNLLGFKSNNNVSVGFELEEEFIRFRPYGATHVAPYTEPQLIALAIVLKKIETFRPIKHVYITKRVHNAEDDIGQTSRLAKKYLSGYTQHSDVALPGTRTDAAAQFNIPPGHTSYIGSKRWRGTGYSESGGEPWTDPRSGVTHRKVKSGLDQVWYYMSKIRKFNLATQVFASKIPLLDVAPLNDLTVALQASNQGQQTLLRGHLKKLWSLRRALTMEARKRSAMYGQALDRGTKLHGALSSVSANVSRMVNRFDTSNLTTPTGPMQSFDESTGTWYEGGKDTGSA